MEVYFIITNDDFRDLTEKVQNKYQELLSLSSYERKTIGHVSDDTTRKFNALFFSMLECFDVLERGLSGKFKWEV